jgi:hypothetical protein
MQSKIRLLLLVLPLIGSVSCASKRAEKDLNEHIHKMVSEERYSVAAKEISIMEKDYPQSRHLCELWKIQLGIFKRNDVFDSATRNVESKLKENCSQ